MENINEKIINYNNVTLEQLVEVVNIKQIINNSKFEEWFNYKFKITESDELFFKELILENKISLQSYNEQSLTIKFIAPILNRVKLRGENFKDWYGYKIECKLNGYILKGEPDLTVATGLDTPRTPYFFMQEYKRGVNPHGNPEYQVLAEMLTAMTLNKKNIFKGSYIIGQFWKFVILEKLENGNYEYFISNGFDSLNLEDLKHIYKNLQAVKFLYCK